MEYMLYYNTCSSLVAVGHQVKDVLVLHQRVWGRGGVLERGGGVSGSALLVYYSMSVK